MKFFLSVFITLLCCVNNLKSQDLFSIENIKKHIYVLASDSLQGRESGTIGGVKTINYILSEYKDIGLTLLGNDGKNCFSIKSGKKLADSNNTFKAGNYSAKTEIDYMPFLYSYNNSLSTNVVFVGYGIQDKETDDYANVDVRGKWVLIFRGKPKYKKVLPAGDKLLYKANVALKNGAAGVLFTSPYHVDSLDKIDDTRLDVNMSSLGRKITLVKIKRAIADSILKASYYNVEKLAVECEKKDNSYSHKIDIEVGTTISITDNFLQCCNVVGFLEGSDPILKKEIIVVGAHHDHLGKKENNTFYGADDNASGTAGVIEIARVFKSFPKKTKRSILFVTFDAEEKGLLGSMEFLNKLPNGMSISQIKAMVNLDMIGKFQDTNLTVIASNSSKEGPKLVASCAKKAAIKATIPNQSMFFYGSDHYFFYSKKIPVFFFFTNIHEDYHNPSDTADKIDFEGMTKILNMVLFLVDDLSNRNKNLQFKTL